MKTRQLLLSIAIIIAATLALYLLIATRLLQQPSAPQGNAEPPRAVRSTAASGGPKVETAAPVAPAGRGVDRPQTGGRKLLEIFGRVADSEGRPLENVLVAEERYFHRARSAADGSYRLLLDIPRHRYPTLHFLRSGYAARLVRLGQKQLGSKPVHELDVALEYALASVSLAGWVGNDLGVGIEGARVELGASYTRNRDSYYLTEFTDANGNFEFEGVQAGEDYKLSVNPPPQYPYYEDLDFSVTQDPANVSIVLHQLGFADVEGMILDRESIPVPGYEIYISNLGAGVHMRKIVSDSSGYFRIGNFPLGEVSLTTRGREFFKITGITLNQHAYQSLRIVIDRGNHNLSGWVSDTSGVAVEKAMVTLDRKFHDGPIENTSYRSQATGADGRFDFTGLGGGVYHVTVYAQGYEKRDFDYRFADQSGEIFITLERYRPEP